MVTVFLWIVIYALFIASFIGLIFPLIPSALLIWIGFLIYHFELNPNMLGIVFWVAMGVLTIILFGADLIANSYFVKRFGGTKWGERGAAIGVIVGSFIIPPFGIIIVPFVFVLLIEILQGKSLKFAITSAIGSFIGFFGGTIAKIILQVIMIIWFLIVVLF